jgi:hypothetical protein
MNTSNLKEDCNDISFLTNLQDSKMTISELDILRKAYELILENSDLFFKELGKSFSDESKRGEFNPMI